RRADRVSAAEPVDQPGHRGGRVDRRAHVVRDQPVARRRVAGAATAQHTDLGCGTAGRTAHDPTIEPPRVLGYKPWPTRWRTQRSAARQRRSCSARPAATTVVPTVTGLAR